MRPGDLLSLTRYPRFYWDLFRYWRMAKASGAMGPDWRRIKARLNDATATTEFDAHYIYHTAWAARILRDSRPEAHVDVGSLLYFVSMVSAFVPITHYDYRPPDLTLGGLGVGQADLLALSFADRSIASLSCMHVVEHVGLGRYGDRLDAVGDRRAMAELQRVLAPGGQLLFVVPVGRPRVVFNSHRIYGLDQVVAGFPELTLERFDLITDGGHGRSLVENADPALAAQQKFGCGCFVFRRPAEPRG
jgi:SAM-dependent methyltransferase